MKLYATNIDENNNIIEPVSISENDLTNNGFVNITSILNIDKYTKLFNINYVSTRNMIKEILPTDLSILTNQEIDILKKYNLYNYFKIYDFLNDGNTIINAHPPVDVDYDILALHKNRIFDKGELYRVEYYGDFNYTAKTYNNLIISEDRIYYRINEYVYKRVMTVKWYLDDGSVGFSKESIKYYTTSDAMQERETRRGNVISTLKIKTVGLIGMCSGTTSIQSQALGMIFLNKYSIEIGKFIQGIENDLKNAIASDTEFSWLNWIIPNTGGISVRYYLISELTLNYTKNNVYIN